MLHEWLLVHHRTEMNYWWFVNKRRWVRALLERHAPQRGALLEVGCGGGLFSSELAHEGWRVISSDLSPAAASYAREQGVLEALAFDADTGWPFKDNVVDVVVMLDMLEHVRDDIRALRETWRVLRPGGLAVVMVPAYPFLFSAWDKYNEHYRRYTALSLAVKAREAGFHVAQASYWNAISVPPAVLVRLKDRLLGTKLNKVEFPKVPEFINSALIAYGRAECAWLKRHPLPMGLSVWAVLKKQGPEVS
jgi:SAM-dependent methyltransferase